MCWVLLQRIELFLFDAEMTNEEMLNVDGN